MGLPGPALSSLQWQLLVGRLVFAAAGLNGRWQSTSNSLSRNLSLHTDCVVWDGLSSGIASHSSESCLLCTRHVARHGCLQTETSWTARSYNGYAVAPATQLILPCHAVGRWTSSAAWFAGSCRPPSPNIRSGSGTHSTTLQHRSTTSTTLYFGEDVLNASCMSYAAFAESQHSPTRSAPGSTSTPASQHELKMWFSTSRLSDQSRQSSPSTYHDFSTPGALESGGRSMSAETTCNASAHRREQCILAPRKMASGFCSRTLSVCAFWAKLPLDVRCSH